MQASTDIGIAELVEILGSHLAELVAAAGRPQRPMRGSWHDDYADSRLAAAVEVAPVGAGPGAGRDGFGTTFSRCIAAVGVDTWQRVIGELEGAAASAVAELLRARGAALGIAPAVADLAAVEAALCRVGHGASAEQVAGLAVNPTLLCVPIEHRLAAVLTGDPGAVPVEGEVVLMWREPSMGLVRWRAATPADRLVLSMALDQVDEEAAARAGGVSCEHIAAHVDEVASSGLVLRPPLGLWRHTDSFTIPEDARAEMLCAHSFTLQWHITSACDLHCRHCYDRTNIKALRLEDARRIVADMVGFCRRRRIGGEICLSGGNPLLHPDILALYRLIASTGLAVSFLGNPTSREVMEELVAIRKPDHFQVSLEGLEPGNDSGRGAGTYRRVFEFLDLLGELEISSNVMLTLGRANLDQVVDLAAELRGHTDFLVFNRLTQVGEGAALDIPTVVEYEAFLRRYEAAAVDNPILDFKDNLFNILRYRRGEALTDGCTGFGCGAAFNFVAVLPDGEVHACRKFPSPIGNILELGLDELYQSTAAAGYRRGSHACDGCAIRANCGGCLAVAHGAGLDPSTDLDPHCFMKSGDE